LILFGCQQNDKDPKRKVHKPVKGVLRLEIEKHQISQADLENISECGSATNDSVDPGDRIADSMSGKYPSNGCDDPQGSISRWNISDAKEVLGNGANQHGNSDFNADDVSIISYD
jgi:dedicator of cytokinesis protein 6/7/8